MAGRGYDPFAELRRKSEDFWNRVENGVVDPLDDLPTSSRQPFEAYEGVPVQTDMIWAWRMYDLDINPPSGSTKREPAKLKGVWQHWDSREVSSQCKSGGSSTVEKLMTPEQRIKWHLSHGGTNCSCGTYATKSLKWLAYANGTSRADVIAHCTCWGFVVEHEHGYRAEKVRIEALWILRDATNQAWADQWAYDLYQRYQVPVFRGVPEAYVYEPALPPQYGAPRYGDMQRAFETIGIAPSQPLYPQMRMEDLWAPPPSKP